MHEAVISSTGLFTPEQTITNDELVASFNRYVAAFNRQHEAEIAAGEVEPLAESSVAFIEKASGIKQRHVMEKSGILDCEVMHPLLPERGDDEDSLLCEIGVLAAREALERAHRGAGDIDQVIVACSNLQRAYPAIAIEIQSALGIDGFAYDMNVACSSATFGIQAAASAIQTGVARAALVVNPEVCSAHLNFRDRDSHFIFGDVSTAMVIERAEDVRSQHAFRVRDIALKTQFSNNIRNNFGFLNRCAPGSADSADKLFRQNGRKVFKEVCPIAAALISGQLERQDVAPARLKRLWLHQANLSMNQLIAKKVLGYEPDPAQAPTVLDEYANTSSAGSIIAFHQHQEDFAAGELGVICSFGAGYSVGSVMVEKC